MVISKFKTITLKYQIKNYLSKIKVNKVQLKQ